MKSLVMTVATIAAAVGLTGCGSDAASTGTSPVTPPGGTTAQSESGAPGSPREPASQPVPASNPPAAPTSLPSRDDATVDARDYQIGDQFYFQSPSGNIKCGFINDNTFGTGCQLKDAKVIPAQLQPGCDNSPARKVAAYVHGTTAQFICLSQGVFVGIPQNTGGGPGEGGGKILNYGETLIVRGTACTSLEAGVRCDQGGHGFFIAADQQYLF
ncbi:DUF6636 domain-containing protein [Nocardia sp. NPDC048505]|uniref:DUF6636 domain-containing protein n=1 Tax=unclassified Nocardia TaxID=2637762 RepID=UPI003402BC3A